MTKPTLNPALRAFWSTRVAEDGEPVRFRTLYGGRMSGKSWDAAGMAIARANHHCERFLCLRMYQNRIADSVYTLLKDQIYRFDLESRFNIFADALEHKHNGSLFRFYGLARNVDEVKSFEGATVAWFEEAHNVTENMFDTVRPTVMRNDGAEMWFTFNPRLSSDFIWKRLILNPPAGSVSRKINYDENKFLSPTALADIKSAFAEDPEMADHIYNGSPLDDDDSVVIKRSWITAAIDAHKIVTPSTGIWTGQKTVGYDVADSGDDKNAATVMDGTICVALDEWKGGEDQLRESAARVKAFAEKHSANQIGYDCIGVGAGTGSHLNAMGWRAHFKFNAGAKVVFPKKLYNREAKIFNEDYFLNLKAQAWWLIADRFRNTFDAVTKGRPFESGKMISISSGIDKRTLERLVDELSTPRRDFDSGGKVKVESKKDLAKRGIASPNLADSFVIAASRGMIARPTAAALL